MCRSGDASKQDDGCAARIGPSFPFQVNLRKTRPYSGEVELEHCRFIIN
jgi:hypothetical protein